MSKYEELSELACAQSAITFNERATCLSFAIKLGNGYKKFLEVPEENFSFLNFNAKDMTTSWEPKETVPNVTQSSDGYWYFGIYINYESKNNSAFQQQAIGIGLRPVDGLISIRLGSKDIEIDPNSQEELEAFFEKIYKEDLAHFKKPPSEPARTIGFHKHGNV